MGESFRVFINAWRIWLATLSGLSLLVYHWLEDSGAQYTWSDEVMTSISVFLPAYLFICLADAVICFGRAPFTKSVHDRRRLIGTGVFQLVLVTVIGLTYNNMHENAFAF
jgi:hypothetical protein